MKKVIILASLFAFFMACKNEKTEGSKTAEEPAAVVEEDYIEEVPNATDQDFDTALEAFRAKDYATASHYITIAINDLKLESEVQGAKAKKQLDATIDDLQALATKVQKGEVTSEEELEAIYAQADMMTSHEYLYLTQSYAETAPEKAAGTFRKAGDRLEKATNKLDGEAKTEFQKMHQEIKDALGKSDVKVSEIGDAAGLKVEKMAAWLKAHAEKLGIKPPQHSDF